VEKTQPSLSLGRRRWFAAAGTVGAVAAVASALPAAPSAPTQAVADQPKKPSRGGGYHASAHVQRYYQTARV
jgi:hypothetical protein